MTGVDVGETFSDAELIVIGRFLLAALTIEQSLKWRIACCEHDSRAEAEIFAQGLGGPLGPLIGSFKEKRSGDETRWEKIDKDLAKVLAARNAVAHGLVVLMRDLDADPNIARPQNGPPLFAFENKGESFTCMDLANLTPTAEELPSRLQMLSLKS